MLDDATLSGSIPDRREEDWAWVRELPSGLLGLLSIYHSLPSGSLRAGARARIAELLEGDAVPATGSEKPLGFDQLTSWENELQKSLDIYEEIVKKPSSVANRKREQIKATDTLLNALIDPKDEAAGGAASPATSLSTAFASAVPGKSAAGGRFTAVHLYWPAILQSLMELGGRAPKEHVLSRVERMLAGVLTSADKEFLPSGVDVRWKNRAAWQRFNMIRVGLLRSDSPRGVWEITDAGRQWLEDFKKKAGLA